ncbi:PadR family [Streptomyces coelicoflavus ZG0656]|nr:PadR family [Streptomyces coelicoflavus ZG0656]
MLKGHLEGMILAVLESGPTYGYAVIETLRERSDGEVSLPSGTIYPALRRLESAGLVSSGWSEVGGRRRRTYELTPSGVEALKERRQAWHRAAEVITGVMGGPGTWTVST